METKFFCGSLINKSQMAPAGTTSVFSFVHFRDKRYPNIKGNFKFPLAAMAVFLRIRVFSANCYLQVSCEMLLKLHVIQKYGCNDS